MRRFSFRPGLAIRGRQFRGLRGFAGKPLHPPLTDITVGAYVIGPVLDLIAFVFKDQTWSGDLFRAGGWVILAGAATSVLTALTGFADWLHTDKGTQIRRMASAHAITMVVLTLVVVAGLWYRYLAASGIHSDSPSTILGLVDLAILGLVTLGGTLGGSLTYDWGFNVETASDNPVYHPSQNDIIHPN